MATTDNGKRWGAFALTLSALACSSSNTPSSSGEGGSSAQGSGGAGQSASSSATGPVASSAVSVGSGGFGGEGGGQSAFVCDPPAPPGSLYELSAESYDLNDLDAVPMCKYRGQVALIVNTAAA